MKQKNLILTSAVIFSILVISISFTSAFSSQDVADNFVKNIWNKLTGHVTNASGNSWLGPNKVYEGKTSKITIGTEKYEVKLISVNSDNAATVSVNNLQGVLSPNSPLLLNNIEINLKTVKFYGISSTNNYITFTYRKSGDNNVVSGVAKTAAGSSVRVGGLCGGGDFVDDSTDSLVRGTAIPSGYSANLEGFIIDENQKPLVGATIFIKELSGFAQEGYYSLSGSGGYFSIQVPECKIYTVRASYEGYDLQEMKINPIIRMASILEVPEQKIQTSITFKFQLTKSPPAEPPPAQSEQDEIVSNPNLPAEPAVVIEPGVSDVNENVNVPVVGETGRENSNTDTGLLGSFWDSLWSGGAVPKTPEEIAAEETERNYDLYGNKGDMLSVIHASWYDVRYGNCEKWPASEKTWCNGNQIIMDNWRGNSYFDLVLDGQFSKVFRVTEGMDSFEDRSSSRIDRTWYIVPFNVVKQYTHGESYILNERLIYFLGGEGQYPNSEYNEESLKHLGIEVLKGEKIESSSGFLRDNTPYTFYGNAGDVYYIILKVTDPTCSIRGSQSRNVPCSKFSYITVTLKDPNLKINFLSEATPPETVIDFGLRSSWSNNASFEKDTRDKCNKGCATEVYCETDNSIEIKNEDNPLYNNLYIKSTCYDTLGAHEDSCFGSNEVSEYSCMT
ncbi:MAG: hypothetical protein Q7S06_03620, partial [Nanoarchaeota archaeon]|nr:hypothetical protein [Nanoarchaeota archaeon]